MTKPTASAADQISDFIDKVRDDYIKYCDILEQKAASIEKEIEIIKNGEPNLEVAEKKELEKKNEEDRFKRDLTEKFKDTLKKAIDLKINAGALPKSLDGNLNEGIFFFLDKIKNDRNGQDPKTQTLFEEKIGFNREKDPTTGNLNWWENHDLPEALSGGESDEEIKKHAIETQKYLYRRILLSAYDDPYQFLDRKNLKIFLSEKGIGRYDESKDDPAPIDIYLYGRYRQLQEERRELKGLSYDQFVALMGVVGDGTYAAELQAMRVDESMETNPDLEINAKAAVKLAFEQRGVDFSKRPNLEKVLDDHLQVVGGGVFFESNRIEKRDFIDQIIADITPALAADGDDLKAIQKIDREELAKAVEAEMGFAQEVYKQMRTTDALLGSEKSKGKRGRGSNLELAIELIKAGTKGGKTFDERLKILMNPPSSVTASKDYFEKAVAFATEIIGGKDGEGKVKNKAAILIQKGLKAEALRKKNNRISDAKNAFYEKHADGKFVTDKFENHIPKGLYKKNADGTFVKDHEDEFVLTDEEVFSPLPINAYQTFSGVEKLTDSDFKNFGLIREITGDDASPKKTISRSETGLTIFEYDGEEGLYNFTRQLENSSNPDRITRESSPEVSIARLKNLPKENGPKKSEQYQIAVASFVGTSNNFVDSQAFEKEILQESQLKYEKYLKHVSQYERYKEMLGILEVSSANYLGAREIESDIETERDQKKVDQKKLLDKEIISLRALLSGANIHGDLNENEHVYTKNKRKGLSTDFTLELKPSDDVDARRSKIDEFEKALKIYGERDFSSLRDAKISKTIKGLSNEAPVINDSSLKKLEQINQAIKENKVTTEDKEKAKIFGTQDLNASIAYKIEQSREDNKYKFDLTEREIEEMNRQRSKRTREIGGVREQALELFGKNTNEERKFKRVLDAPLPYSPYKAISVLRPRGINNIATVTFNDTSDTQDDILYLHIPGTDECYVRVRKCIEGKGIAEDRLQDTSKMRVYKNGEPKYELHKYGDIVIDEGVIFHKDKTSPGKYEEVPLKKLSTTESTSKNAEHIEYLYKSFGVKAVSVMENNRHNMAVSFAGRVCSMELSIKTRPTARVEEGEASIDEIETGTTFKMIGDKDKKEFDPTINKDNPKYSTIHEVEEGDVAKQKFKIVAPVYVEGGNANRIVVERELKFNQSTGAPESGPLIQYFDSKNNKIERIPLTEDNLAKFYTLSTKAEDKFKEFTEKVASAIITIEGKYSDGRPNKLFTVGEESRKAPSPNPKTPIATRAGFIGLKEQEPRTSKSGPVR